MRQATTILILFVCCAAYGQQDKKVQYQIDLIGQDSFYLQERTISRDKQRPDTLSTYTLFRDTTTFINYIEQRSQDADNARIQAEYFKAAQDSLSERVKRLEKLAKDVFGINIKSNKRETVISVALDSAAPPGFWVVYPINGKAKAEYLKDIKQITARAIILNNNGTTFEFKPPKKTPKTTKNK
jgi:hypothetical protein